jgi:hypothetical protein
MGNEQSGNVAPILLAARRIVQKFVHVARSAVAAVLKDSVASPLILAPHPAQFSRETPLWARG